MIKILVDESYAFDYLSILHIKSDLDKDNLVKKANYINCYDFLKSQLEELFTVIINSVEYTECYNANLQTFDAVDRAKTDSVPASYVDKSNYRRHIAKQNLQKSFFFNDLSEIKIGYEKYGGI